MSKRSKIKLTKATLAKLRAPDNSGKQKLYWDADLKGFGVLCSGQTNAKTFVVQRDINGKTRRITIGAVNVKTIDEARERAIKLLAEMADGIDPKARAAADAAAASTLSEVLEKYLEQALEKDRIRVKTAKEYRAIAKRYFADWNDKPLRDITGDMVHDRHREIAQAVVASHPNWNGHSSANGAMRVLRKTFNYGRALGLPNLTDNPVSRLSGLNQWYKEPRREGLVKATDLPSFHEAVKALPSPIHRDYLILVLFTGLRRREAAALRWDEVDLDERVIRLPRARTKAGRKLDLPMSDYLQDLFVARRAIGIEGPWVFPADSKSGHLEEPKFALTQIEKATGIKVTVHDLRRTFITVAESCDIPVYALKGLANHSMGTDVTAGYILPTADRLREPMQKVTNRFKELIGLTEPKGENVAKLDQGKTR